MVGFTWYISLTIWNFISLIMNFNNRAVLIVMHVNNVIEEKTL